MEIDEDPPPTPSTPCEWSHDTFKILGRGTSGVVFRGSFNGKDVAVKRIDKLEFNKISAKDQDREEKAMTKLNHPNVLKLFHVAHDDHFK